METLRDILTQSKALLECHYGARFKGLVLYGSTARHEAGPESDIDLLVLLGGPFDYFQKLVFPLTGSRPANIRQAGFS